MAVPTLTDTDPRGIASITLRAREVLHLAAFYQDVLGLVPISTPTADAADLGVGGRTLLRLRRADVTTPPGRVAGLFHAAYLMPDRPALASWLHEAIARDLPIVGASDHGVSEAIYLTDPEGNGIEVYADRDRSTWRCTRGDLQIPSDPLDLAALLDARERPWESAPADLKLGHIHLATGDIAASEQVWTRRMGHMVMHRHPDAVFLGWMATITKLPSTNGAGGAFRRVQAMRL
ncbi:MAG: VOC family protein, partial [Pseudomonadota bacterium]